MDQLHEISVVSVGATFQQFSMRRTVTRIASCKNVLWSLDLIIELLIQIWNEFKLRDIIFESPDVAVGYLVYLLVQPF